MVLITVHSLFLLWAHILLSQPGPGSNLVLSRELQPETVVVFIPHNLFRDDELNTTVRILERHNIPFIIVSTETTAAQGIDGLIIKPQRLVSEIKPVQFSAFVLVNGSGIAPYWQDTTLWQCCREFFAAGRPIVALELAPLILARAGLLKNRNATVYPDYYTIGILRENGARHRFGDLIQDDIIITTSKAEHTGKAIRRLVAILRKARSR